MKNRIFDSGKDKVLWVAHRTELIKQAKTALEDQRESLYPEVPRIKADSIDFDTIQKINLRREIEAGKYKLLIIDEAHHTAAPSYQPAFSARKNSIGGLGLTATPSRHDGLLLILKESLFLLGFPSSSQTNNT